MGVHHRVVVDERHPLAVLGDHMFDRRGGTRRTAEVERLRGIEQLDGQHPLGVEHHAVEFGGGVGAHAHMVFLPLRRGDRVDRGGHAQPFGLADDRRRGVLRDHETAVQPRVGDKKLRKFPGARNQFIGAPLGDVAQLGEGYGEEIHRQRDGLAVEIPRRDDHVLVGEDRRVVGGAVDLGRQHALDIVDGVLRSPVHLGDAAERIGILYVFLGACGQLAAFQQAPDVACRGELPAVGADQVHLVAERLDAPVESVERQRPDAVGPLAQAAGLDQRPDAVGAHELRTVEQRQPLLGLELDRLPPQLRQHAGSRAHSPLVFHFAQPQQRQAHVGQRRQVARCAQRTLLVDHGQDVVVEKVDQPLHGRKLHARMAVG